MNTNVVVLRVTLDEGATESQLKQLVLDIEKTRAAQAALSLERRKGITTDEDFAKQTVDLRTKLKGQQQEQTALTKNLELYRTATGELANSYVGQQAQLSLAQNQYKLLEGSQTNSTESTKALSATIAELRNELKTTDETQLLFSRNLGNYPKPPSLEPVIAELVRLQEIQKALPADSKEAAEATAQIGFSYNKLNESAAAAGLTQQDINDKLADYGERIRPAVSDLAKLEVAQQQVAKSAGKDSQAYTEIGFKIGALRKEVAAVPTELAKLPTASEKATAKLGQVGGVLEELDEKTGAFGGTVGELKGKFEQAKAGVEAAKVGFTGLKGAIAATGIGVFLLALGALYSYLTRTQEGLDFVERKTKGVSVVIGVLTDKASAVGKLLFEAFDHPKQSLSDLVDFLEQNVENRLKSVGVILDGIIHLDFRKLTDGVAQAATGITDATSKAQALGTELGNAAKAGEAIAAENQRIRDSERAVNLERAQSKKDIEALKLVSEDVTKSTVERAAATQKAAALEQGSINKQLQLQRDKITNIEREQQLTNTLNEGNDELVEEKQKLAELEENSLTRQIELNNKLNELRQLGLDKALADQKAYYERQAVLAVKGSEAELAAKVKVLEADRAAQLAAQGLTENQRRLIVASSEQAIKQLRREYAAATIQQEAALEQVRLDGRLLQVQAGSDEELAIQRRKLAVQREADLSAAQLTVRQRTTIEEGYLAGLEKLERESAKNRALAAYEAELSSVQAELLVVKKGSQEEAELKIEAINTVLEKELASLEKRGQNVEKAALLRAKAESDVEGVRYAQAQQSLDAFLQGEKNALEEARAEKQISETEYQRGLANSEITAAASRLQLARSYNQEEAALSRQLTQVKIAQAQAVTDAEKKQLESRQQAAEQLATQLTALFAESLTQTGKSLEDFAKASLLLLIDSVTSTIIGEEIKIVARSFASADSIATFGATGGFKALAIIAALTAATAPLKAILTSQQSSDSKFAQGTVLGGASHANGGTQLYDSQGFWYGEAEAGEAVINRNSTALFLPLLSAINQMGGGRALVPGLPTLPRMAVGSVLPTALAQRQLAGNVQPQIIDYTKLAAAIAKNPPITRWVDFQQASDRNAFTDRLRKD